VDRYVKQLKQNKMTTTNKTNAKKTVNANQQRLSEISSESKNLQKSLGAIRSFLLEHATELKLSDYEKRFLLATKKNELLYKKLKESTQHTEKNTTCVYWTVRTIAKFEREKFKIPTTKKVN
jgi:hypothetical protein